MKKFLFGLKLFTVILVIVNLFFIKNAIGQTNTWDGSTSNNWNTASNWSLNAVPTSAHNVVINMNAAILVNANATINSLAISNSAIVSLASSGGGRTITIDNSGSSIDAGSSLTLQGSSGSGTRSMGISFSGSNRTMSIGGNLILTAVGDGSIYNATNSLTTVSGTIKNDGSAGGTSGTITSSSASLSFLSGGNYEHALSGGTIPTASWNAASTCNITGITGSDPSGDGQAFGNLIYDCAGMTGSRNMAGSGLSIAGNLEILNTGSGQVRMNQTPVNVSGNLIVNDNFRIGSGTARTLNVLGDVSISGGTLTMTDGGNAGTMNVTSNFSATAGTITETGTGSGAIVFNRSGTQTYTSGSAISNTINFTVNSGSTLQMAAPSTIVTGNSFTLSAGAGLGITSPAGITSSGAAGNIQTTSRSFNTAADYIYNGSSSQATGNGMPVTVNNFTLDNSSGITLPGSITLNGTLTLNNGILTIPVGNTLTVANGNPILPLNSFDASKNIVTQVNNSTGAKGFLSVNNMAASAPYLFPVGDGSNYLPVTLTPSTINTFSVCSFTGITANGEPDGIAFSIAQKNNCVNAVWTVNHNGAVTTSATDMTVAWPASLEGTNFQNYPGALLGIAHYGPSVWGPVAGTGNNVANTATRSGVTTFSPFGVGKQDPSGGVLAIKITYFNASKGNGNNTVNWQAACSSSQAIFEVERSTDGVNFTSITTITATQARCAQPFSYVDNTAPAGTVFYRLKIVDVDGKMSYSAIVKLGSQVKDIQLTGIAPNPVMNVAQLKINTTKTDVIALSIISLEGKVVYRNTVQIQSGSSVVNLDIANLPGGMYMIKGMFSDGQTNTLKFTKK